MKKITWKLVACFMAVLLLCMPVLTGCDKPEEEPETTVGAESKETTEEETPEEVTTERETAEPENTVKGSEGLEFTSHRDGTCSVSGIGECSDTDIVIPQKSPEGDRVTSIGERAFYDCTGLTSITIPDGVTSIGGGAFVDCTGLESITFPNSMTSIGEGAFINCTGLTGITIPDSVTSIGVEAFRGCSGLVSMNVAEGNSVYHSSGNCLIETESKTLISGCQNSVIPIDGSVTSIGRCAFYGCIDLMSITIPDSVTSIGGGAFVDCTGLASITIPDSVTSIGEWAFNGCKTITSITIPAGVTSIGEKAFYECNDLMTIEVKEENPVYHSSGNCLIETQSKTLIVGCHSSVIPDDGSVTSIEAKAFYYCEFLMNVTIPDGVTSIGDGTFWGCTHLTSIIIPDSVTSIGEDAFRFCLHLTSVTIPDSVTSIPESAFLGCSMLRDVTYNGTKEQWNAMPVHPDFENATVHCTDGDITPEP